ncbi:MAG: YqaA family protein [Pseudomonadota bacterium]
MIRALYDWVLSLAGHRRATWALGGVSFAESSVFPIPPDLLLIPMVIAKRHRAWWLAFVCTVTSVLGGLAGYAIGAFFYDTIGQPVLAAYGKDAKFAEFATWFNTYGSWAVFVAGVTPFPYKVITIASGVASLDLVVFTIASIASRGLRFFAVAGLLYFFGPSIREFIEKRLSIVFTIFVVFLIGGFIAIKYLI